MPNPANRNLFSQAQNPKKRPLRLNLLNQPPQYNLRNRRRDPERMASLQQALLEAGLVEPGLRLHRGDAEVVRPWLDSSDPQVQQAVLGYLKQTDVPAEPWYC